MNRKLTFIDLLTGIGGFKTASSENCKVKHEANFGDIAEIKKLLSCDIPSGGVPCQSWSIAGEETSDLTMTEVNYGMIQFIY